jgi:prophage regulatory protein
MSHESRHQNVRLLRFRQVRERVGLSRSTVTRLQRAGVFPPPIRVTENTVAWVEHDIDAWVRARIAGSEGGAR